MQPLSILETGESGLSALARRFLVPEYNAVTRADTMYGHAGVSVGNHGPATLERSTGLPGGARGVLNNLCNIPQFL